MLIGQLVEGDDVALFGQKQDMPDKADIGHVIGRARADAIGDLCKAFAQGDGVHHDLNAGFFLVFLRGLAPEGQRVLASLTVQETDGAA